MQTKFKRLLKICLGMLFILSACAGLQEQVTVGSAEGEKTITMKASNFEFTPNNVKVYQGDEITINMTNVSDGGHNFTIKDPQGQIIKSVDLPPKQTLEIKVTFSEVGEYPFSCNKPFHSSFGMKGQIGVVNK